VSAAAPTAAVAKSMTTAAAATATDANLSI
jgi:hypothetical protein